MRNPLDKRLPREIKKNKGRYLAIFLLLTSTIVLGSSFMVVSDSIHYTLTENQKNSKIEDGHFQTVTEMESQDLIEVEKLGVSIEADYYVEDNEFDGSTSLRLFFNRDEINKASIFEGSLPRNKEEVALDRLFASNRGIQVGDSVEVDGVLMKVTGLISLPDYNSLFKNNSDLVMNALEFGVALVSKEEFTRLCGDNVTYNYSYYFNDRDLSDKEKGDLSNKIKDILVAKVQLTALVPADKNQAISFLEEDMGQDVPTMKTVIYVIIGIMAFVFVILIDNTIEEEAAIIGTLRASGYKKNEVLAHYMKLPILVTLLSALVGNLLGYTVMIEPFKNIYYKSYSISPFLIRFNVEAFLITTIVPIGIMIVIQYLMLRRKLSLSPLRFLRKDLNTGKLKKAIKLPQISFISRFRMRVIWQNKGSYLTLFAGIFFASFLLMFGIGMLPLVNHYVDTVDESLTANYQYMLKGPVACEKGEAVTAYTLKTYYSISKDDIEVTLYGLPKESEFYKDVKLPSKRNQIVVSNGFAKKLGLGVGDELSFRDSITDEEYILKIADVYQSDNTLAVYMKQDYANKMLGKEEGYYNSYFSNDKLNISDAYVAKVITRDDMTSAADQLMVSFKEMIQIITIFSIGIYLVLMYLLTKVVIDKNAVHISFMKVFGYQDGEIRKLYLRTTTITVIVSLLVCIPLEIMAFKIMLVYALSRIEGYLEFYLPLYVYIQVVLTGVVSYFVINAFHIRKIRNIPISVALKNRE